MSDFYDSTEFLTFEDAVITGDWATVDRTLAVMDPEHERELRDTVQQSGSYQRYEGKSKDFSEHLHPRDEHGRFAEIGGLGDTALRSGGFSLSLAGDKPDTGWMVSQYGTERSISIESLASEQPMEAVPGNPWHTNIKGEIDRFVADHGDDLRQDGAYLGGWVDGGRLYLDVSHNIPDEDEAMRYARDNHQLAAYNVTNDSYVEFDQEQRHAASREAGVSAKPEKVLLKVTDETDTNELTTRLMKALFSPTDGAKGF